VGNLNRGAQATLSFYFRAGIIYQQQMTFDTMEFSLRYSEADPIRCSQSFGYPIEPFFDMSIITASLRQDGKQESSRRRKRRYGI
jgi:hypothetical protein